MNICLHWLLGIMQGQASHNMLHLLLFAGSSRKPSWRPWIWTARRSLHVNGVLKGLDGHHDGKELGIRHIHSQT